MPFSFSPGQEQQPGGVAQSAPAVNSDGVPVLQVPTIPTIVSGGNVEDKISPFAFRNRNKSNFSVYFQGVILFVFGVIFIASVGLFAYQSMLKAQISSKKEELDALQVGFKKPPIEEMQKLSSRLGLINKIMNERASVRTAFIVLEESINPSVVYNKFSLSKSKKNNYYDLSFAGQTNSYSSIYQQIEILNSKTFEKAFPKITISGIGPLDKKGLTSFKAEASVAIAGVDPDIFTLIDNKDSANVNIVSSSTPSESIDQNGSSTTVNVVQ